MKREICGPPFHSDYHYYTILALFHFIRHIKEQSSQRGTGKTLTKCSMRHCLDSLAPHQLSLKKTKKNKKHQHQFQSF